MYNFGYVNDYQNTNCAFRGRYLKSDVYLSEIKVEDRSNYTVAVHVVHQNLSEDAVFNVALQQTTFSVSDIYIHVSQTVGAKVMLFPRISAFIYLPGLLPSRSARTTHEEQ